MRLLSALAAVFVLTLGACAAEEPAPVDIEGGGVIVTTSAAPPAATATTTAVHDEDDAMHEDDAGHEDDAMHEDDAGHEDDAVHEEDEPQAEIVTDVADRTIEVTLSEFAFSPAGYEFVTDETVELVLTNEGAVEHEFRLTTAHAAEEHLAGGHEGHDDADATSDLIILVAAGETKSVTVHIGEPGSYDLVACLIPGHFEAGMKADLAITG